MVTTSNKRKAIDLDGADIATFIERTEVHFQNLQEQLACITKKLDNLAQSNGVDKSLQATKNGSDMKEDESTSDDDESIVDEADKWGFMFRQLRDYRIANGDCSVPTEFFENAKLGKWVANQRFQYNNLNTGKGKQKLHPQRIIKLNSLGFCWGKKYPAPASWNNMFEALQEYQQRMGNCNVPCHPTKPTLLARWAAYQRTEYKRFAKGKDSLLTLDQIGKLETIGMNWNGPKL